MLKNIIIKNYRGIKNLEINDFKKINLLVGDNNSGKTSVLEAIFLMLGNDAFQLINLHDILKNSTRTVDKATNRPVINLESDDLWNKMEFVFNLYTGSKITKISSKIDSKKSCSLKIIDSEEPKSFAPNAQSTSTATKNITFEYRNSKREMVETGFANINNNFKRRNNFPTDVACGQSELVIATPKRSTDISEKYSTFCRAHIDNQDKILKILQKIEPRLLRIVPDEDITCFIDSDKSIPINYMGDGVRSILHTIVTIYQAKDGIVLIDEIENGLHWKAQKIMWEEIIEASTEANVQIFATTHSYEMIECLDKVYREYCNDKKIEKDNIGLIKLKKSDEEIKSIPYDSEEIKYALEDEREIR